MIEAGNWIRQSEADIRSATHSYQSKDYYVTAFLCQQAVEKALKAYMIIKKKDAEKFLSIAEEVTTWIKKRMN